ncbi:unnamed protein product, partial [Symbiodinium pilosum]
TLVHSESEPNLVAAFEDLCWLCKEVGGFDLKSQLVQVHADYAPGIAAARRQRRTKKLDPDVAKICELSDLTRCLPTLQLADVIWQVIF